MSNNIWFGGPDKQFSICRQGREPEVPFGLEGVRWCNCTSECSLRHTPIDPSRDLADGMGAGSMGHNDGGAGPIRGMVSELQPPGPSTETS